MKLLLLDQTTREVRSAPWTCRRTWPSSGRAGLHWSYDAAKINLALQGEYRPVGSGSTMSSTSPRSALGRRAVRVELAKRGSFRD